MTNMHHPHASLAPYPIEVEFPNIRRWRDSGGIDYIHTFDSHVAGPHVMVLALNHGNEVSGAIAVDTLLASGVRPIAGRLSLGFANVEAYERFDPRYPDANRFVDEDLNRVWHPAWLDGTRDSIELRRARELRPLIDSVDLLLDIHSMHEEAPPLMMCGPLAKGLELAIGYEMPQHLIIDTGHANGTRLRDYGRFGNPHHPANALLIETGQHFSRRSSQVALDSACRFLLQSGVVNMLDIAQFLGDGDDASAGDQYIIQITQAVVAKSMAFEFAAPYTGMEVITKAGTVIACDSGMDVVTPHDNCIIVQPSLRQLAPGIAVARLGRLLSHD
ncbi:succinylglutamate desuccinylase/aspartoacylase domain-containing protein [Duganella hordei]|uniref:succinylglutamate desuccinylase/aspartoacylase domain-containing protein n=1 Tax=Duganella hordei TaxID=2865934 RepID=UPI0030EA8E7E